MYIKNWKEIECGTQAMERGVRGYRAGTQSEYNPERETRAGLVWICGEIREIG